ncbi:carbon-nitrogen hydrolase [Thermoproteota archaeon]
MEIKIALLQTAPNKSKKANLALIYELLKEAVSNGANIVCLPELFLGPYFCQEENEDNFKLAEPIPGPVTDQLSDYAKDLGIVLIASLFEKRSSSIFHNTAVVFDSDGTMLGNYRKMHIPHDTGYYEKFYFTPGDLGYPVFDTAFGRIAVLICWDQWFPEAARLTALQGAQIIFYPTAIGWDMRQKKDPSQMAWKQAWQAVQIGHGVANSVFIAAINRTGVEGNIDFWGSSFVSDPQGTKICEASEDKSEIMYADLDMSTLDNIRQEWPFFRDRRVDSYNKLLERWVDD